MLSVHKVKNHLSKLSNQWMIASVFLGLSLIFTILLVRNIAFQTWAFEKHQNLWSWYIRPILIVPIMYFAYKRQIVGVAIGISALFTSMIWFPTPSNTTDLVIEFLAYAR